MKYCMFPYRDLPPRAMPPYTMPRKLLAVFLSTILIIGGEGCSGSGDEFWTSCGVVQDGENVNPVESGDGEDVEVTEVVSESRLVVRNEDNEAKLIKLAGVKDVDPQNADPAALVFLHSLPATGHFFENKKDCTITKDNIKLIPGTVIVSDGRSLGEELILHGFGEPDDKTSCGSGVVNNCYAALAAEANG